MWIVPGATWLDTRGNPFNAHAGGLTVDNLTGRFYWFGEAKYEGQDEGGGVSVYSSDNLATWTSHGLAFAPEEGHPWISPKNVIQRPKVLYSRQTQKYHMWWHADDAQYSSLLQGLATSEHIAGPYKFEKVIQPLGGCSQDFGVFTDYKDGQSYALYSSGDGVEGRDVFISAFNDTLTDIESVKYCFQKYDFEAPTIIQTEKSYFAIMSHKTGYRPNNVIAMRADSLSGPWSQPFFIAPAYTRTFSTQSGFSWTIRGTKQTTHLYIGDQWDACTLWESRNVWLPVRINENSHDLKLLWHDVYDLNVETGEWTPIEGKTYYARYAETTGDAFLQEANFGSYGVIATGIYGQNSTVTFTINDVDDMGFGDQPFGQPDRVGGEWQLRRISSITLNDDKAKIYRLLQKSTHKGIILSTAIKLPLKNGPNKLRVGGLHNGHDYKGADLDRVVVYPPEPCIDATGTDTAENNQ